jgi:hypothetical protein
MMTQSLFTHPTRTLPLGVLLALAMTHSAAFAGGSKVEVCHEGDQGLEILSVSENAVSAHIDNHGDTYVLQDEVCGDGIDDDCDGLVDEDCGAAQVSAGWYHSCAVEDSGELQCWGDNRYGQLDAPEGSFTQLSAGGYHSCAVEDSGELQCWGYNRHGQRDAPEGSFTQVSAGGGHSCAVEDSGDIQCWGNNGYGQSDVP